MEFNAALKTIYETQLRETPEYKNSIDKRLAAGNLADKEMINHLATLIIRLTGDDLPQFCRDYKWICDVVLEEELHFRRNGDYRLSTFQEALDEVYNVPEVMRPYMNGLLMTQLWWLNHTHSISFLKNDFLPSLPENYSLAEIGPGHGLLMSYPATDPRCKHVEAWDLSEASLAATRLSLKNMGIEREIDLRYQDLFEADPANGTFDGLVFSEVLEHLEEPARALKTLQKVLKPEGKIYIHMPINSPAPDHIFNVDTPDELNKFIEASGLKVVSSKFAPMVGYTLERAIKRKATISCLFICAQG